MSRLLTAAGQQVAELGPKTADSGRLSRGRTLFRKGSVTDVEIATGTVTARVRGSGGEEYFTTLATSPAPPGVQREVAELPDEATLHERIDQGLHVVPRDIDVVFDCTCPDWEEPCKHALALLLAFADRVDMDANELLIWRDIQVADILPARRIEPQTSVRAEPLDPTAKKDKVSELEALLSRSFAEPVLVDAATMEEADDAGSGAAGESEVSTPELDAFLGIRPEVSEQSDDGVPETDALVLDDPAPLFAVRSVGPLGELAPHLTRAIDTIADMFA